MSSSGASPETTGAELQRTLGRSLPAVERLDEDGRAQLLDAVKAARKHQRQTLAAAMEGALAFVPALLRGPLRKIFGG